MINIKWKLAVCLLVFVGGMYLSGKELKPEQVFAADSESAEAVGTEEAKGLKAPEITKCSATSDGRIKLVWSKVKNADKYEVFRSTSKGGEYIRIGTASKASFTDKKGKKLETYYYRVRALKDSGPAGEHGYSDYSKAVKKKVRKPAQRTAYAGDSVMQGFSSYEIISSNKKTMFFTKVGIHLHTFYNGEMLKQLLSYNPDRLFIMLGMNGLVGKPDDADLNTKVGYFGKIIRACLKKNPDMEVVVLGVSPVGRKASVKKDTVKRFNKKLKKRIKPLPDVYYYDTWEILSDSQGYLKGQYGGGDGIHWKKCGYEKVKKDLDRFIKEY